MPSYYNAIESRLKAEKEASLCLDYKDLLKIYLDEMNEILTSFNQEEGSIPLNNKYYTIRNKYQYVLAKFTKE